jgi:sigma-B regulation protein RsbU (phosphoserine phosphatase)
MVAYMLAGLIAMAVNYRAVGAASRRKLRVVMIGSGAGFLNILLMPFGELVGLKRALPTLWGWLDVGLLFTVPLIPISFAYAIIRHKVIPVSLIIRRGARYMLVSRGSAALEAIAAAVVVLALLSATHVYLQSYPLTACVVSAGVGIIVWNIARKLHARYLGPLIDRRFFRQAYDSHQIIAELTESLRTTTGMDHLLKMVATRVQSALQTENVTIFLRDEATRDYPIAYSCDYNEANGRVINRELQSLMPHYADVVKRLSDNGKPLDVEQYVAEGRQVSDGKKAMDTEKEDEMEVLKEVRSSSLFPLSSKGEMLGIISLGPRLGDLPYSREDEQMLMSVAGPATLAIENAILVEQMIVEAGLRQELEAENAIRAKELEEARQLQLSMLPKSVPQLPHLEIEAYMKPAAEVGGDYYDFHLGDDGVLTVAVGDATGHGLKAGTVVTAMKSLFRSFAAEPEIVPVLDRSSRVLKEMNLRSLFMGLTMVKLNGRRMKISSAGMPPALVYRAETGVVEEVMIKAMPLGSVTGYSYREREITLGCGDVVVLMSDGLPERFNRTGEMFDYSRTMETLARAAAMAPREIIERLVDAGEAWAEGRPQDDDITFVAVKVKL